MSINVSGANNQTFLNAVIEGARHGAVVGAAASTVLVGLAVFTAGSQKALETGWRALGMSPQCPYLEGDCSLPQFSNLNMCKQTPIELAPYLPYGIILSTLLGAGVGAVHAAAKHVLYSDKN